MFQKDDIIWIKKIVNNEDSWNGDETEGYCGDYYQGDIGIVVTGESDRFRDNDCIEVTFFDEFNISEPRENYSVLKEEATTYEHELLYDTEIGQIIWN